MKFLSLGILLLLLLKPIDKVLCQKARNFHKTWIGSSHYNIENPVYLIEIKDSSVFYIPHTKMEQLELSVISGSEIISIKVEGKNKYVTGAVFGFLGGSVVGAVIGRKIGLSNCGYDPDDFAQAGGQAICVIGSGLIGSISGGLIGALSGAYLQKGMTKDQIYSIDGKSHKLERYKNDLKTKTVVF